MSKKLQALFALHRLTGRLLCKELGHDWQDTEPPGDFTMNVIRFQQCSRCDETRQDPDQWNSSSGHRITFSSEGVSR